MPEPQELNGAYYGPSIPPSKKAYHRHSRGGGSSCNPFTCCCNCICGCIFNCIFQIIFTLLIFAAIVIFVLWLVFRPNKVKFYADDASLSQFEFSTNKSTLHYNLALNLTVRNPNKRLGIYYDSIEARAFYQGQKIESVELDPFYQGHKNTSYLHTVFHGQNSITLGSDEISNYNQDKSNGVYDIDLKLHIRMRLKFWWFKSPKIKPTIDCSLKVPFNSSATFDSTECGLDW